jgi:hypothetical protein
MSTILRIAFLGAIVAVTILLLYRPRQFRSFGRRLRIVGFAYVAAVLISAAHRVSGVVDWS